MSRTELADAVEVHYQTIGYLERGEYGVLNDDTFAMLRTRRARLALVVGTSLLIVLMAPARTLGGSIVGILTVVAKGVRGGSPLVRRCDGHPRVCGTGCVHRPCWNRSVQWVVSTT